MATVRIRAFSFAHVVLTVALLSAAPARAEDAEKARELYRQGSKHYDVGQFDKAIESWQQAYDQKPDPSFLYNIAQAYRQKEDAKQAIFFYKSYLRNSPKATNKAEVQQRIDALQKQLDAGAKSPASPAGPLTPATPPAPTAPPSVIVSPPTPVTPPPSAGPVALTQPPPPMFGDPPQAVLGPGDLTAIAAPLPEKRLDLTAALGFDTWSSGLSGSADPSLAFTLGAGYTFGSSASTFRFRLGGLFGYTFLTETNGRKNFLSFLVDPGVEIRLTPRWFLTGDLGLGVLAIGGLEPTSALLEKGATLMINGTTQSLFLARFGAGVHFRITRELGVFVSPAVANSAKRPHFYENISRVELLFGLAVRP